MGLVSYRYPCCYRLCSAIVVEYRIHEGTSYVLIPSVALEKEVRSCHSNVLGGIDEDIITMNLELRERTLRTANDELVALALAVGASPVSMSMSMSMSVSTYSHVYSHVHLVT